MNRAYLAIIFVVIFLLVFFLSKITMHLCYRTQGKDDHFALDLSLWRGLIHYKLEIPVVKMQSSSKSPLLWPQPAYKIQTEIEEKGDGHLFGTLYRAALQTKKYYPMFLRLLNHIELKRFNWTTEIGAAGPAQTGIFAGAIWGLKFFIFSYICRMCAAGKENPIINVKPNFKTACFNSRLDCIFKVRIGYIIFTSLMALLIRLKE